MRRFLAGITAATLLAVAPGLALADNQEVAEQIARNLRDSGQMADYKIGVKYQDGVAWLRGRVADEDQLNTALRLVFKTQGVTRVVNELTIGSTDAPQDPQPEADPASANPLRGQESAPLVAGKARPPQKSFVKQLESMLSREQSEPGHREQPTGSHPDSAIQMVAAQESEEGVPMQMSAPQRVRPIAPTYVAMQPRGPVAPNAGAPLPMYTAANTMAGAAPARYDQPCMPNYAWPSYAAYPNYAAVTYPKQYSPTAWPYIGPFYPYPQVPLGWRKVTLEWDDGWWFLDFRDTPASCWHR